MVCWGDTVGSSDVHVLYSIYDLDSCITDTLETSIHQTVGWSILLCTWKGQSSVSCAAGLEAWRIVLSVDINANVVKDTSSVRSFNMEKKHWYASYSAGIIVSVFLLCVTVELKIFLGRWNVCKGSSKWIRLNMSPFSDSNSGSRLYLSILLRYLCSDSPRS